jgi:hypothetical protein
MEELLSQIKRDPIARTWSASQNDLYLTFSRILFAYHDLIVKVGKGGLSYYKTIGDKRVFIAHFNASPRKGSPNTVFADFRLDSLRSHLDLSHAIESMRLAASPDTTIKLSHSWCSFHFPTSQTEGVAALFKKNIVSIVG